MWNDVGALSSHPEVAVIEITCVIFEQAGTSAKLILMAIIRYLSDARPGLSEPACTNL